jgi:hypothetical protein
MEGCGRDIFLILSRHLPEGIEKNNEKQELNLGPPVYEAGVPIHKKKKK